MMDYAEVFEVKPETYPCDKCGDDVLPSQLFQRKEQVWCRPCINHNSKGQEEK